MKTNFIKAWIDARTRAHVTPYEISEAHKTHMLEVERKRAQAFANAHRQALRGL